MERRLSTVVLSLFFLSICFPTQAKNRLIMDVNDVSILLPPITDVQNLNDYVGLDFATKHGVLFTKKDFEDLIRFSDSTIDNPNYEAPIYEKLRLVGVRFEPCAKGDPIKDSCHVELRLVFQPFIFLPNPLIDDFAIHLIFELPSDEADDLIGSFIDLKAKNSEVSTNGVPLGIHPVAQKQGMRGPYVQQLKAIITKFAGRERLRDATATINFDLNDWRFVKGTMQDGILIHAPIPHSPTMNMTLNSSTLTGKSAIIPESTSVDHINRIIDSLGRLSVDGRKGKFFSLPKEIKLADINLALRIDNPQLNGPATTDCISCHQASRALARVNGSLFLGQADSNPNRFVAPPNVTSKFFMNPVTISTYSMRAFGYSNSTRGPEITQGVVNSSMDVADKINKYISEMKVLRSN